MLRLVCKVLEIAFAVVLMALFLAVLLPNLGSPESHKDYLALLFWALVASTPTFAIAFGCLRRRLWMRLSGWTALLLLVTAILHK